MNTTPEQAKPTAPRPWRRARRAALGQHEIALAGRASAPRAHRRRKRAGYTEQLVSEVDGLSLAGPSRPSAARGRPGRLRELAGQAVRSRNLSPRDRSRSATEMAPQLVHRAPASEGGDHDVGRRPRPPRAAAAPADGAAAVGGG